MYGCIPLVYELPGLVAGWSDPNQIRINGQMLENQLVSLTHASNL